MTAIVSNLGEKILLEAALGKVAAGNLKLKLFVNNVVPDRSSTLATFTEMSTQGYADLTLTMATWGSATAGTGVLGVAPGVATIAYPAQTFTFDGTGGATPVYGYYITDNAETTMVASERFSEAQLASLAGDEIEITPQLTLGSVG